MSLCIGDRLVWRLGCSSIQAYIPDGHLYRVTYTRCRIDNNWPSWWWVHGCSKHVENWNKHIRKKELCVKLVIYKEYTEMHGQQNIKCSHLFGFSCSTIVSPNLIVEFVSGWSACVDSNNIHKSVFFIRTVQLLYNTDCLCFVNCYQPLPPRGRRSSGMLRGVDS